MITENRYINAQGELVVEPLSEADIAQRAADEAAWQAGAEQRARDAHNAPIFAQLAALDTAAVRPLRSIQTAIANNQTPSQADKDRLTEIETEAATLRAQLMK